MRVAYLIVLAMWHLLSKWEEASTNLVTAQFDSSVLVE